MTRRYLYLALAWMLVAGNALPLHAQQHGSDHRQVFIRTMPHPHVRPEERRAFAARPGVDTMLIGLVTDSVTIPATRFEAGRVLAYVQTPMARAFIEHAVRRGEIHPDALTGLIMELVHRPDRFGVRMIEIALQSGTQKAKLAAIIALRALPPDRERELLAEVANDPDPVVANAAKLRLDPPDHLRDPPGWGDGTTVE